MKLTVEAILQMAFYLVCFSCAWDPEPDIVLTALKSFGFLRPVFCPHEKGEIILAKGLLLKKAKHLAGGGLLGAAEPLAFPSVQFIKVGLTLGSRHRRSL